MVRVLVLCFLLCATPAQAGEQPILVHTGKAEGCGKSVRVNCTDGLARVLARILPSGWRALPPFPYTGSVAINAQGRDWTAVLTEIGKRYGLIFHLDWQAKTVSVRAGEGVTLSRAALARDIAAEYRLAVSDFCAWNNVRAESRLLPGMRVRVTAPPKEGLFRIVPGSLSEQLVGWCARANYDLIWMADVEYIIGGRADFGNSFEDALQSLFQGLTRQGYPLRATLYRTNSLLTVSGE
ncbi:MAG: TcpQ domain-containing protein [Desulfovibrionaceae bacterium]|nr:TcpQ domain-containing protein [Desulfovibrionaceae bacterium]